MINDNTDDFTFDCAYLLCYEYHEIYLDLGGSHINFPDWIKSSKATINLLN